MSILDSPIKIGQKIAPNRIVNQPMECNDADEVGNPTDLTFGRYRKLAEGGAGIIIVEALTITQESRARKNQLGIYEKTAPTLERLVKEMKGINSQSLILFQITHSGQQSGAGFSRLVSVYPLYGQETHILTEGEIEKIGDDFGKAALIAKQVGADGIDFKQCHGYLCAELLRPVNTRKDRFGGSFENRTRFFSETMDKIKKAVGTDGSFLLGARFSVYEGIPGGVRNLRARRSDGRPVGTTGPGPDHGKGRGGLHQCLRGNPGHHPGDRPPDEELPRGGLPPLRLGQGHEETSPGPDHRLRIHLPPGRQE